MDIHDPNNLFGRSIKDVPEKVGQYGFVSAKKGGDNLILIKQGGDDSCFWLDLNAFPFEVESRHMSVGNALEWAENSGFESIVLHKDTSILTNALKGTTNDGNYSS